MGELRDRFEGLFSGVVPEPGAETEKAGESLSETVVASLLESETPPAPAVAAPVVAVSAEAPPVPIQPEESLEIAPVSTWDAQIRARRTRILNILLGSISVLGAVLVGTLVIFARGDPALIKTYVPYFIAYAVVLGLSLTWRVNPTVRAVILVTLAYIVGALSLRIDGPLGMGGLYLMIAPLLFSVMVGQQTAIISAIVSALTYVVFVVAYRLGLQPLSVYHLDQWDTVLNLGGTFTMLVAGATFLQWMFHSTLASALQQVEEERAGTVRSQVLLKKHADELTMANALLQRRTLQLQTAAQISQAAASVLDPDELEQQAVSLIHEQFGLYTVGLFLIDESGQRAVLQAGAGETGGRVLEHSWAEVGDDSAVGQCTANAQACGALHVSEGSNLADALLLPEARSEIALPLRSRGRVIGALDVQSVGREAFSQEDIAVLQTMADQIAVAIDNAQLFAETLKRLEEAETSQRVYLRERWTDFVSGQVVPVYERTQPDVVPVGNAIPSDVERAMTGHDTVVQSDVEDGHAALVAPIRLRGEVIGALGLHDVGDGRRWTADEIALVEAVASQMALAIDNARLLDDTRQRAQQDRLVADITTRVRASVDLESILQTAVRALGAALGADRTFIQLKPGAQPPQGGS